MSVNSHPRPVVTLDAATVDRIVDEPIARQDEILAAAPPSDSLVQDTLAFALDKIDQNLHRFGLRFPAPSSVAGTYEVIDNVEWTNGFWTGMLWLASDVSGQSRPREIAMAHLDSYEHRLAARVNIDHHDLGFLYSLSAVAASMRTADVRATTIGLRAATVLLGRYLPVAGVIQAWGDLDDPVQRGRIIIDCNLNLPLLFWASRRTGDERFSAAARHHLMMAGRHLVRADASTFHTFYFDPVHGLPMFGRTHQGYADDSCWARGQAWGIYGFALGYRHTRDPQLLRLAKRLANYYLNRLPQDGVCYWDLHFTCGTEPRDSSAAAIAACGMLELADLLPPADPQRQVYRAAAVTTLGRLASNYLTSSDAAESGLLRHAVYHMPNGIGVDESCIWGDYFFLEGLVRMTRDWEPFW